MLIGLDIAPGIEIYFDLRTLGWVVPCCGWYVKWALLLAIEATMAFPTGLIVFVFIHSVNQFWCQAVGG